MIRVSKDNFHGFRTISAREKLSSKDIVNLNILRLREANFTTMKLLFPNTPKNSLPTLRTATKYQKAKIAKSMRDFAKSGGLSKFVPIRKSKKLTELQKRTGTKKNIKGVFVFSKKGNVTSKSLVVTKNGYKTTRVSKSGKVEVEEFILFPEFITSGDHAREMALKILKNKIGHAARFGRMLTTNVLKNMDDVEGLANEIKDIIDEYLAKLSEGDVNSLFGGITILDIKKGV